MKVYRAINAVQGDLAKDGIGKERTNTFDNYKFRGIDDVYNALAPLLAKHGLCILPRIVSRSCEERQSQKGGALFYVTVEAEFDFVSAEDGTKHTVKTYGEAMDRGDKATNKAMSAAYKYAAFQTFAIPTEGNADADSESHVVAAKPDDQYGQQGALTMFAPQAQAAIRRSAAAAIAAFDAGNEWGAFEEVMSCVDALGKDDSDKANQVKLAFNAIFKPHSALRAALKKLSQQEHAKEHA